MQKDKIHKMEKILSLKNTLITTILTNKVLILVILPNLEYTIEKIYTCDNKSEK